jgi:hypothetical protein
MREQIQAEEVVKDVGNRLFVPILIMHCRFLRDKSGHPLKQNTGWSEPADCDTGFAMQHTGKR